MAKKEKKLTPAQQLDARVRALETHNGWEPGEIHEEPDSADATDTGNGKDADADKDRQ